MRHVGVHVDPGLTMGKHIAHVLNKAPIAKTQLMRMRSYCTQEQLSSIYNTLVWSALELENCAHASDPTLRKLEAFQQSTLRRMRVNPLTSMSTRRKTAHAAIIYR
jgi:hypothetical protein